MITDNYKVCFRTVYVKILCECQRMELVPTNQKKAKRLSKGRIKELSERRTSWGVNELLRKEGAQVTNNPPILTHDIFCIKPYIFNRPGCSTNTSVID